MSESSQLLTLEPTGDVTTARLRQYQLEAVEAVIDRFFSGREARLLIEHPTGLGKTVLAAGLLSHPAVRVWLETYPSDQRKVLFLAHRDELLAQAVVQFRRLNPTLTVSREDEEADAADVLVASVPGLGRETSTRLRRLDPDAYRIVIIDEAHHAVASTYRRILAHFDLLLRPSAHAPNVHRLLLGLTATPNRADAVALEEVFDAIAHSLSLLEMIESGHLSRLRAYRVLTGISLDDVPERAGDFSVSALSRAINEPVRNDAIVAAFTKFARGRKGLVFAADVRHADALASCFRSHGYAAAYVAGDMPSHERVRGIDTFRNGGLEILVNCMLLTEGFDCPAVDCVVMARPTQSPLLYRQMVGRGTRLAHGKDDCLVLDFVDNTVKHNLQTMGTLLGFSPAFDLGGRCISEINRTTRTVVNKYSKDFYLDRRLSVSDLEALAVEVKLWTTDEEPHWILSAAGEYVIGLPGRTQERMVVFKTTEGWQVRRACLHKKPRAAKGFQIVGRVTRRTPPPGLDVTFETTEAAQRAVTHVLAESARRRRENSQPLAEAGISNGASSAIGAALKDRSVGLWRPSVALPGDNRVRLQGRTSIHPRRGCIVLAAETSQGMTCGFGLVVFGEDNIDGYLRHRAPSAARDRVLRFLVSLSAIWNKHLSVSEHSDRELWRWVCDAASRSRLLWTAPRRKYE